MGLLVADSWQTGTDFLGAVPYSVAKPLLPPGQRDPSVGIERYYSQLAPLEEKAEVVDVPASYYEEGGPGFIGPPAPSASATSQAIPSWLPTLSKSVFTGATGAPSAAATRAPSAAAKEPPPSSASSAKAATPATRQQQQTAAQKQAAAKRGQQQKKEVPIHKQPLFWVAIGVGVVGLGLVVLSARD